MNPQLHHHYCLLLLHHHHLNHINLIKYCGHYLIMIFRLDLAEWTSMLARWRGFSGKARYTSQLYTLKIHFCGILIKLASFILPMGRVSSSTANITNPKTDVSTHHISMFFTLSSVLTDYENEFCQKFSFEPPLMIMNRIRRVQEYFNSSWPVQILPILTATAIDGFK